jgi:hypothetical protein
MFFRQSAMACLPVAGLLFIAMSPVAAQSFAAAKTKGQLWVEYVYESSGSGKDRGGMYDPVVWRAKRTATLTAEVFALPAQEISMLHGGQKAAEAASRIAGRTQQAMDMNARLAPSMQAAQAIAERCGDDEACMEREAMKLGQQMQGNGQLQELNRARDTATKLAATKGRYQFWGGNFGTGTYLIDETADIVNVDPICMRLPGGKCKRKEVRHGNGALPAKVVGGVKVDIPTSGEGVATGVEWDSADNTLALRLPVPGMTPGTETITSDEPAGTYEVPIPKGPQPKLLSFPVAAAGDKEPLVVKIKGDWRRQTGEQTITLKGGRENSGKLIVRWRFTVS